jgi:S1-C subfamily serine protease
MNRAFNNQNSGFAAMPSLRSWLLVCGLFCGLFGNFDSTAVAQLPPDMRDLFSRLATELDPDLSKKFQLALQEESCIVEFTPEQFRRFRSSPLNPFDGLDDVDAADGTGNIALRFELPSLRNRTMSRYERQHSDQLERLRPLVASIADSVVGIFEADPGYEDRLLALGTVVDASGLIVTKASEVELAGQLICKIGNHHLPGRVLRIDQRNDLALVAVEAGPGLIFQPVRWTDSPVEPGMFVVSPGFEGNVMALGTYSTNVRSTVSGEQAFLGVQPQTTDLGVLIQDVRPGSASYEAGLRDGDVIVQLDGQPVTSVAELVHLIRSKQPGEQVNIQFIRSNQSREAVAKLSGRKLSGERASRFKMMSRLGAIPSRRDDGFPVIFQHDSPLFPEECGGPLVDLEGNFLGINIARNGRAASYAIPASHLKSVVENLKRTSVASLPE